MTKVNIKEKLSSFEEMYVPKIVGELNGQYVKLVKFKGPYIMHKHDQEDELFWVLRGSFTMKYEDHEEVINEGEFVIVPRGVEHCPVAEEECHVALFEPSSTLNTGSAEGNEFTRHPSQLEKI